MNTAEDIREMAMLELKHLYKLLVKPYPGPVSKREREKRYSIAREMALTWGILNLQEVELLEHKVKMNVKD